MKIQPIKMFSEYPG